MVMPNTIMAEKKMEIGHRYKSDDIVRFKNVNLLNPKLNSSERKLLKIWFGTDPLCRSLDEVIAYAQGKIIGHPEDGDSILLLGVAVLKKLILRCKGKNSYESVRIPEGLENFCKSDLSSFKADKQINTSAKTEKKNLSFKEKSNKFELYVPSIDLQFRVSNKLTSENANEKSLTDRLAECLEERAHTHFYANNFAASAETLNEVIELFPDRSHLYSNRATCYLKLEKFKDSLRDGLKAVQLDRSNIDGWLCVGESHFALGTSDKCVEDLEKISNEINNHKLENLLSKFIKLSDVLSNASKAFEKSDFETAAKYYLAASKVSVSTLMIKLKLSECFVLSGNFDKAVAMADKLLKDKNSEATGYCILGLNFYYQNMKVAAFENFDKCLSVDDGHDKCKELYKKARDVYFYKDRGNEYFNSKRYDVAFEMYSKGQNVDPKNKIMNAIFNFNIGLTFLQQQKVADAIRSFSIAIDLHNEYIKALLKRADIYREVHQFQDAVTDLEAVCKITPSPRHKKLLQEAKAELKLQKNPQKYFCSLPEKEQNQILAVSKKNKGNTLFRSQDYHKANELYSAAITLDPDCPLLYSNRSACQLMLQNYDESMLDAVKSLELDGTYIKGYLRKGKIELILGKGEVALQTFNEGLKNDPNDKDLKKQKDKAIKLIRAIIKGNDFYERKDFAKSTEWFSEAADIAPKCSDVITKKLESLTYCNHYDELHLLLQQQEKDANYFYIYALKDYLICNKENAYANIEKALQANPIHSKALSLKKVMHDVFHNWEVGRSALNNSNFAVAQKFLKKALVIDPLLALIFVDLGMCYAKQGEYLEAICQFSQAIKLQENRSNSYIERAKCHDRLNNFEDAIKDFEKAYELLPASYYKQLLDEARLKLKRSKRRDYYKVLSVASTASMEDIRKAYKRLAMEYHPDRHVTAKDKEEGEAMFKEINEAYNVLSDPLKRERYDRGDDLEDERVIFNPFFFMSQANGFGGSFFPFF